MTPYAIKSAFGSLFYPRDYYQSAPMQTTWTLTTIPTYERKVHYHAARNSKRWKK